MEIYMGWLDIYLLKIAIEKGYCTIYSSYDVLEEAKQKVVDNWGLFQKEKEKEKNIHRGKND
jgi:hypothetical protein